MKSAQWNLPQSKNFTGLAQVSPIKQNTTIKPVRTSMFVWVCFVTLKKKGGEREEISITQHENTSYEFNSEQTERVY